MSPESQLTLDDLLAMIDDDQDGGVQPSAEYPSAGPSSAVTYAIQASTPIKGASRSHRVYGTVNEPFDASFDAGSFQPDPDWLLSRFPMFRYYLGRDFIAPDDTIDFFLHRLDADGHYLSASPDAHVTISAARLVKRFNETRNA